MARTRSAEVSPPTPPKDSSNTGNKRAADPSSSPAAKRSKTSKRVGKVQTTIEESMDGIEDDKKVEEQIDEVEPNNEEKDESDEKNKKKASEGQADGLKDGEKNVFDEVNADTGDVKASAQKEQEEEPIDIAKKNKSVIEDKQREAKIPSSILEKGIIYFFYRSRVGIEDPQGIEDVARSYLVLRPLPLGSKLGEGPLEDLGNARLLALPKKMLPKSTRDRFLIFVEKPKAHIKDLREQFASNEYPTKTSGTSHSPAATPFAEGVYAITSTGRESHLAYEITAPKIGELQKDLGVNEKGSYVVSIKNPNVPGPASASIANPAKYPEKLQKKFRDLRWHPLEPEFLDYGHTQLLIIGEGMGILGKAVEEMSKDQKDGTKEKPEEEIEQLEEEDHERVEHLKESDPVFADLDLNAKEYSKMKTTW